MRNIFIDKKTTLLDYIYGIIFSVVSGVVLGLIYVYKTGGF